MQPRVVILILWFLGWAFGPLTGGEVRAQPSQAQSDEELKTHLDELRRQVEDKSISIVKRERMAMEMAATLDRSAQSSPTVEARRGRWTEAIGVLDRFVAQNPGHPRAREFSFQAAVYLWARARSWQQPGGLDPADRAASDEAVKDLDAALARLLPIYEGLPKDANDLLSQNVRFRLAQALADRAKSDAEGSEARRRREEEALKALERPITEPMLKGFALLLQAELLGRVGRFEPAMEAIDAASKANPAPPAGELLATRIAILTGQKRFDRAIKAIDAAPFDAVAKDMMAVRVLLEERASLASISERSAAESALFRRIAALRASGSTEARAALVELARRLIEPDANQGPEAWEAVAEGALAMGDLDRASRLEIKAASRADALGRHEQAATLRHRAGAYLFQAERYDEADAVLTQVVEDPKAGATRAGAGMLRALARGRALALRQPGASRKSYTDALEAQIRDFPQDPVTHEARWLLGRLKLATSERDAAVALWSAIAPGTARWVDTRIAIAKLNQEDLDTLRISGDRQSLDARYKEARAFLTASLDQAVGDVEKAEIGLALVRLDLTPIVGEPDEARQRCEKIQHSATQPAQRDRARRLHIVALCELNRFVEAERDAREEATRSRPVELLEGARLLDHPASDSESDLRTRRFGSVLRILLTHALDHPEELSEDQVSELQLRLSRALLFRGDDTAARRAFASWNGRPPEDDDRFLKDLSDTYFRFEAYPMAIDVERLRLKRLATGSLPWFEARYRLSLAQYRSGKAKDALHLIDATAILHPELGGGQLRDKFLRLRQRISTDQ